MEKPRLARIVSPARDELSRLRPPLTVGEQRVLDFFDALLSPDWEIYVQPYLNGLRPDFVLLNPAVGVAVFEVKDWKLGSGHYAYANGPNGHELSFRVQDSHGNQGGGAQGDPLLKIRLYRDEIYELYCPRLDRRVGKALITAGLIFPSASDQDVVQFVQPALESFDELRAFRHYWPIVGTDSLASDDVRRVFPEALRGSSKHMNETLAGDLRDWLREPVGAAEQRLPLRLDARQRQFATTRTDTGFRRIKGPAGAGKSLVLAARAAELVADGKDVLVVSFNITMLNYLQDQAVRWSPGGRRIRTAITWLNFHAWCKRVCMQVGREREYAALWAKAHEEDGASESVLDEGLAGLTKRVLTDPACRGLADTYDAILVDEGQDFRPSWWDALRMVRRDGGEMMLVADATQDLYGTATRWTDEAMLGAGFRGEWSRLEGSYRLPPSLIPRVRTFAERFIPEQMRDLPELQQLELDLFPCATKWVQAPSARLAERCADEVLRASSQHGGTGSNADVVFLASSNALGRQVVGQLADKGIHVLHTFDADEKGARHKKQMFFMGDARIKATTVHSFKGWESRTLVVGIEPYRSPYSPAATYVALTRVKRNERGSVLVVVCGEPSLAEYGAAWGRQL